MRQKLGQHFLRNPAVAADIAAALDISAGDTVIEVGPGHGELTQALVAKITSLGLKDAKLVAVEKDVVLAEEARRRFKEHLFIEVVHADILEFLSAGGGGLPGGSYKMAGNIPYYLTGYLLRHISEMERKPALAVFLVQKEVAERIVALPPHMNRLAAAVRFWAEPRIIRAVSRKEFSPPPKVESAVIALSLKEQPAIADARSYYRSLRVIFAQPRKTVANNLKQGLAARNASGDMIGDMLRKRGIPTTARPQDLNVADIAALASAVDKLSDGWG